MLKADNDKDIYLVFEYMEVNLHAVIRANILEEVHKKYILYQCLKALKFIHSGDLLHRDMKPSNVLLNSNCHVKLCDFGLARSVTETKTDQVASIVLTEYVATRWYRAPEILLGSSNYTKGVDMWSVGCILGELLGGTPMFPGTTTMDQLEKIMEITGEPSAQDFKEMNINQNRLRWSPRMNGKSPYNKKKELVKVFPNASEDAIDLMKKLLCFKPGDRLTAAEALAHPYLAQFHNEDDEGVLSKPVHIAINDNKRYTINDYRKYLYKKVILHKQELRRNRAKKSGGRSDKKASSSSSSSSSKQRSKAPSKAP